MLCRRGRAAASSAATRLATQLLVGWASLGRPPLHHALRRVDKAPGGRGISFLLFEPHRRQPPIDAEIHRRLSSSIPELLLSTPPRTQQSIAPLSASANPSSPATELFPFDSGRSRRRGCLTAASSSPSFSTATLCFVEVAVSPWSLCAGWFAFYPLVVAGARAVSLTVRHGCGQESRRE